MRPEIKKTAGSASTMKRGGQVTLPLEVRQRLGLKPGDKVEFLLEEGRIVLTPMRPAANPFDKWIGILTPPEGMTGLEWFRSIRYSDELEE